MGSVCKGGMGSLGFFVLSGIEKPLKDREQGSNMISF